MKVCKNCLNEGENNYCNVCGSAYEVKRITLGNILNEVLHTFSHFDKGFLYSLKQLTLHPGSMQRKYLDGQRTRNQKPFAMFFFCATLYGLAEYFIISPGINKDEHDLNQATIYFYRHYFIFLQTALTPVYTLIFWLLFKSKEFNYAEALVTFLYSMCYLLLLLIPINMVNLIPGHINEQLIEIPLLSLYLIWTNLNFFKNKKAFWVIMKSIILLITVEYISNQLMHFIIINKLFH